MKELKKTPRKVNRKPKIAKIGILNYSFKNKPKKYIRNWKQKFSKRLNKLLKIDKCNIIYLYDGKISYLININY